jgi:CRISPR-associated protein Cmr1
MIECSYRLTFNTPAFLGNAEQNGQWRTPPIKALLRQWWRVAYAAEHAQGLSVEAMRHAEGVLFGHAWLENDRDARGNKVAARRSEVRLRLGSWERGTLQSWDRLEQPSVQHPEVEKSGHKVGPHAALARWTAVVVRSSPTR